MPILEVDDVDAAVWKWVKEEIANPVILERKLREIQSGQKDANAGKVDSLRVLQEHKTQIEQELKRLAMLYAREDMPAYLIDQLIADQTHKLGLTNTELSRLGQEIETPLTDETISGLLAFSQAFHERLETVEQSFEGRLTVIEGLEVTVEALTKDGAVWLRMKSILQLEGVLQALSLCSRS